LPNVNEQSSGHLLPARIYIGRSCTVDPDIIDVRPLKPFDLNTIGNSIKRTHRVLIVEKCMHTGGIGASLRAAIIKNFWDYLDSPIMRLSSQDVPTPYADTLGDGQ
jgi:pyruvate dehydrogenase E1 component beta subunit